MADIEQTSIVTGESFGTAYLDPRTRVFIFSTTGKKRDAGDRVFISHVLYFPTTASDDLEISEYAADGSTTQKVIHLKATAGLVIVPVERKYDPPLELNGLAIATIDNGKVEVTMAKVVQAI